MSNGIFLIMKKKREDHGKEEGVSKLRKDKIQKN